MKSIQKYYRAVGWTILFVVSVAVTVLLTSHAGIGFFGNIVGIILCSNVILLLLIMQIKNYQPLLIDSVSNKPNGHLASLNRERRIRELVS